MIGWAVRLIDGRVDNIRAFDSETMDLLENEYFHPESAGPPPEYAPPLSQLIEKFRTAIQKNMDAAAVAAGYDDMKTAVTYAEEPAVPKFQAEGQALRAWRSLVWAYGYEQIKAVQSGEREMPTVEELVAELPALVMP